MVDPKNGWLRMGIQSAIATLVVVVVALGCASSQVPSGIGADSMVQTIGDVSVSRDGGDSVVRLAGLVDPIYSVRTPADQKNLVVVDLVGVGQPEANSLMGEIDGEEQQVAAYDGVVDLVSVSTFDDDEGGSPLTRVEVIMTGQGRADVFSDADGLGIRIIPSGLNDVVENVYDATDAFETAEMPSSDWGVEEDYTSTSTTIQDATIVSSSFDNEVVPVVETLTIQAPPAATTLTGVTARTVANGVLVNLQADGEVSALEAFTLDNPSRLVVDLPGLTAASSASNVKLDSGYVTGIRVGDHSGKVRIVLDGGTNAEAFQGRQIMPGTTGLLISIGEGDSLETAMDNALLDSEVAWSTIAPSVASTTVRMAEIRGQSEDAAFDAIVAAESPRVIAETYPIAETIPVEEELPIAQSYPIAETFPVETEQFEPLPSASLMAETVAISEVYGLHYERTNGMDRTAILSDDALGYTTTSPDPTTLVVRIQGARISEEASDRIFPQAGGPVSLIHAFQQPEVFEPEVRVVFTRAPNQQPVISRQGSMLFVDFENLGVAAAAPPAFPNAGEFNAPAAVAAAPVPSTFDELVAQANSGSPAAPAVVSSLPSFDQAPAAPAPANPAASVWNEPTAPAAVEVPAAIEVLEEGGLIDGKEYRGRRVSLDFKDVAIADVLRLIAEVSDLNVIAGDEVKGNVTIRLVEVPWDQALDVILMTKGLGFVRVGNVLRIAPNDVLKAEEEVRLQERRNKEKLEDLEVKLLPVNYAAVGDTEGLVKRLLSARGTVNLDERTNTLIIKDISSVIDEASALISAIDTQTPQVMIEAKIVEANLDFSRQLGSVWGIQTQQFADAFDPTAPRTDLGSQDLTFIDTNSLAFANPIAAVPTGLATVGALILDQDFRVDAQIQAAESTGDGKVVSSPRIVTLDNSTAKIEQGVSIPFQTFEGGDAKLEFIDAVLSLEVTPHITADESVIMEIEVNRNAPDNTIPTPTGSPAIAKNVAETETLVKDGQTLVLGGIYTVSKSKTQTRVPYLHRIPVIGNVFKNNQVLDSRKELLVFVTPRIVRLPEMAGK